MFEPWMFAAMEEEGYMDTPQGRINRVAKYLVKSPNKNISAEEFRKACAACNIDPDCFTQSDIDKIQKKLNELS